MIPYEDVIAYRIARREAGNNADERRLRFFRILRKAGFSLNEAEKYAEQALFDKALRSKRLDNEAKRLITIIGRNFADDLRLIQEMDAEVSEKLRLILEKDMQHGKKTEVL
jgi:DNA-binding transcriptional MerR regulator